MNTAAKEAQRAKRPDARTLAAFALIIVLGGGAAVAARFTSLELPPFWGALLRFGPAVLIFWGLLWRRGLALPRGRALWGAIIFGVLSVGFFYAFFYFGLVEVQAGFATLLLALGPLFTALFAALHGQEALRWRGVVGSLIALVGIYLTVAGDFRAQAPLINLLAMLAAAMVAAEALVIYKGFPKNDPLVTNTISVSVGVVMLFIFSLISGESMALPQRTETWAALIYVVPIGTVLLFLLYLYVLDRWTASATSYAFLLFPVSATLFSAWLTDERITPLFVVGGALVLLGVWVGALAEGD